MYNEIIINSLIQDTLMKKKSIVGIIFILLIYTGIVTYYKNFTYLQGDNGYSFKCVDVGFYKVLDGDNYINLVCDFSYGGKLVFQGETYEYDLSGYKGNYHLDIRYPDGGFTKNSDHTGVGSSTKYDTKFIKAAITTIKLSTSPVIIIFTILKEFFGLGLLAYTKEMYDITHGWILYNAQPSSLYLLLSRILGLFLMVEGMYEIYFVW